MLSKLISLEQIRLRSEFDFNRCSYIRPVPHLNYAYKNHDYHQLLLYILPSPYSIRNIFKSDDVISKDETSDIGFFPVCHWISHLNINYMFSVKNRYVCNILLKMPPEYLLKYIRSLLYVKAITHVGWNCGYDFNPGRRLLSDVKWLNKYQFLFGWQ